MTKKLVVLGAGIGGLSVLQELTESEADLNDLDITVIDEDFSHFLGFTLPWVMRGWRGRDSVTIRPSATALAGVHQVVGTVSSVEPSTRTVKLADGTALGFNALVISTGARNAVDKVPGLSESMKRGDAVHYYSADAAAQAHQALLEFSGGSLVFLVTQQPYRCPVAPYEGSLLAADLLRDNNLRSSTIISVYSPEKHPMPSAGPFAGPELVGLLNDNGIAFFGDHAVARIEPERKEIHFQHGAVVPFDLLVFVPPHVPAVTLEGQTWISVDASTMQTEFPGIFAIGDTTAITSPSGRPLPKAAIFARNGAKAAAINALHHLGKTDTATALSGEGHCYIDTGSGLSALGQGDFFTMPHPAIHLSTPSEQLHHDKHGEERDWRATWECDAAPAQ